MTAAVRQKILLVDDEPQVLIALEDLLTDDYIVVKTESGEQALKIAASDPDIAAILSDQRMPEMTGDQLLSTLTGVTEASRVLVTGYADISAVVRAVNEGKIFAYVSKPWDPEAMRMTVNKAVEHFTLQRELARERQLLHDLMESVPDGIFFKDRDLRFQRINRALVTLLPPELANDPACMLGRKLSELGVGADALDVEAQERLVIERGETIKDVVDRKWQDGIVHWYSTSRASVRSPEGVVEGLVGIARDITERVATDEALRVSEERLRLVVAAVRAGLFDWSLVTNDVVYSNDLAELLGEEPEDLGRDISELFGRVHVEHQGRVSEALANHLSEVSPALSLECPLRTGGGSHRWYAISLHGVWNAAGKAIRVVGAISDITERKSQQKSIAKLSRVRAMLGSINGAVARLRDREALLQKACDVAVRDGELAAALIFVRGDGGEMTLVASDGVPSGALAETQLGLSQFVAPDQVREQLELGEAVILDGEAALGAGRGHDSPTSPYGAIGHFPLLVAGTLRYVFTLASRESGFFDKQEVGLLADMASNLAFALEHDANRQHLSFLLSNDPLTGLARRDLFVDRLQQRLAADRVKRPQLAALWFDASRFRHINDTLGRAGGDAVLREIASRLETYVGDRDSVARVDGNAFGIISPPLADEADVIQFLESTLLAAMAQPIRVENGELRISGTIGISIYPNDGANAETLVSNAEMACKAAKASGQPYLFYTGRMNEVVAGKLAIENRLRKAIEEKQFLLHYQPKVDLRSGSVVGLEALIRWHDPTSGLVAPGAFIPVLEETGLILPVGKWVLLEAARQHTEWLAAGLEPPRIAINVSSMQLADADFLPAIERVFELFPSARHGMDLEITESVLMGDFEATVEKLSKARQAGLRVAVDDFGTGYSSLGYLSRLPVDALKIDRSFVVRMEQEAQDLSIVTTIIALAHALELTVIAEGVEETRQASLLRLLRCDQLQGFLVSRPVPASDVPALLNKTYTFGGSGV
jgi:diguanylate cyclase (GGDEF)-like protein/PAS domain S-box-containing protein